MNMYKRLSRLSPCKECVFVCVWVCLGTQKAGKHSRSLSCPTSPPTTPPPPAVNTPAALSLWTFSAEKAGGRCFFFFFSGRSPSGGLVDTVDAAFTGLRLPIGARANFQKQKIKLILFWGKNESIWLTNAANFEFLIFVIYG